MAGKVFISYRRGDDPSAAARVRDALAARFGKASLFMDVDSLAAGQLFDRELAKALSACDVFIAIIGQRWMDLLRSKSQMSGLRDYVREEIALALTRKIVVVPVRVGSEGHLPPLPRAEDLPSDIQDLVHYQKHDVVHERFASDIAELADVITRAHRSSRPKRAFPWAVTGAATSLMLSISLLVYALCTTPGIWLAASTMMGRFYLGGEPPSSQAAPAPSAQSDRSELERAWAFIKETDDQARLEAFIRQFGDSPYAEMARARLNELKRKAVAMTPSPSPGAQPQETSRGPSADGRGWLGVKVQKIDLSVAERFGLVAPRGALVTEVITPGPAAEADLRTGDAILSVDGRVIADSRDFAQQIASFSPGTEMTLAIVRERKEGIVVVKLGMLPSSEVPRTQQLPAVSQFNGEWRVIYSYNGNCARRSGQDVGHWTITDSVVIGRLRGDRGTLSRDGEVRIKLFREGGHTIFAVRAHLTGSQGTGSFRIEGRACGGVVTLARM